MRIKILKQHVNTQIDFFLHREKKEKEKTFSKQTSPNSENNWFLSLNMFLLFLSEEFKHARLWVNSAQEAKKVFEILFKKPDVRLLKD